MIRDGKKDVAWSAVGIGGMVVWWYRWHAAARWVVDETDQRLGLESPVLSSHVPNPALAAQWPAYRPLSSRRRSRPLNPPFLDLPDARRARVATVTTRHKRVHNAYCG